MTSGLSKTSAIWHDAGIAYGRQAVLRFTDGQILACDADGKKCQAALSRVVISSRLGNTPRHVFFPDGVLLTVEDNDFIDAALNRHKCQKLAVMLYKIESSWVGLATVVFVAIVGVFVFFTNILPLATDYISNKIPPEILTKISDKAYRDYVSLGFLRNSQLDKDKIKHAGEIFAKVLAATGGGGDYRISLRIHSIGIPTGEDEYDDLANTFALPDGLIIAGDSLVNRLTDDEFAALMAHEISHVRNRHGLRSFLQTAVFDFSLSDQFLFSIGSLSLGMMDLGIIHLEYSREFENEADCSAYLYLRDKNLSPSLLADALQKLDMNKDEEDEEYEEDEDEDGEEDEDEEIDMEKAMRMLGFLFTHPDSDARNNLPAFCQ